MTGIFFGSTMGTTEAVAADIAKQLGVADADVHNVADTPAGEVQKYDLLVLGSSTWGAGELHEMQTSCQLINRVKASQDTPIQ